MRNLEFYNTKIKNFLQYKIDREINGFEKSELH